MGKFLPISQNDQVSESEVQWIGGKNKTKKKTKHKNPLCDVFTPHPNVTPQTTVLLFISHITVDVFLPTKPKLIVKSWAASASPETSSSLVHLRAEADGRRVPDLNVRPCSHYCCASSFVIGWKLSLMSPDWTTEKHARTQARHQQQLCTCARAAQRPEKPRRFLRAACRDMETSGHVVSPQNKLDHMEKTSDSPACRARARPRAKNEKERKKKWSGGGPCSADEVESHLLLRHSSSSVVNRCGSSPTRRRPCRASVY